MPVKLVNDENLLKQRSPVLIALGLAGILFCVVLMINWIGSPIVSVNTEILEKVIQEQLVDWAYIDKNDHLHVHLKEIQTLGDRQQPVRTDRLLIKPENWDKDKLDQWVLSGNIEIKENIAEKEENSLGGILFILLIIGAGAYYLWRQAQWNLRYGSPRKQIDSLSNELKDGNISQEEYQKKLDDITPHL